MNKSGVGPVFKGMKTTLLAVTFAVVALSGSAAFADDWHGASAVGACPTSAPSGYQMNQGKYELQSTQQWVPGGYVQVYRAPVCTTEYRGRHGRHVRQHCSQGGYVSQWVDAHYETQQQWVWVQYPQRQQYQPSGWQQHGRRGNGGGFGVTAGPNGVRFHVNGQL